MESGKGAPAQSSEFGTVIPTTYVIDYDVGHLDNPGYVELVRKSPPELLHLGKDVAITHNWGPIEGLGGENQFTGGKHSSELARRISPDEVAQRIEQIRQFTYQMHEAGVKMVMPYICMMTIAGDPDKRLGFWDFYDHWEEYSRWIGPKPEVDPIEWMQREPGGDFFIPPHYKDAKYYAPSRRWSACPNNPSWRQWLKTLVRLNAECGYDGVFVDNSNHLECCCEYCRDKFRAYLAGRYSPDELQEHFGTDDPAKLRPDQEAPGRLGFESNRFRCVTTSQFLGVLGDTGRGMHPQFRIFHNWSQIAGWELMTGPSDFMMIECGFQRFLNYYWGCNPGIATIPEGEKAGQRKVMNSIFAFKYAQCADPSAGPIVLTNAFSLPWRKDPAAGSNETSRDLGFAEMGAFGSAAGWGNQVQQGGARALSEYGKYYRANRRLYEGLDSYAQIGVALFTQQGFYASGTYYEDALHLNLGGQAADSLLAAHVLFDLIDETKWHAEHLLKYRAVIVPTIEHPEPWHEEVMRQYVDAGGRIIRYTEDAAEDTSLLAQLSEALDCEASVVSIADSAAELRVNAFARSDGNGGFTLTLHLVNYAVPLGGPGDSGPAPAMAKEVAVKLPLPRGWQVTCLRCHRPPSEDVVDIEFVSEGETVRFTVPEVGVYRLCELTGRVGE